MLKKNKPVRSIQGTFCRVPVIGEYAFIRVASGVMRTSPVVRYLCQDNQEVYLETQNTVYMVTIRPSC